MNVGSGRSQSYYRLCRHLGQIMIKKYFPSPSKQNTKKLVSTNKILAKRITIKDAKKGKSLRKEFDLIVKKHYSMLTTQEIEMVWHRIGTQIAHNKSRIGSLKNLIIESIRLNNISP